MSDSGALRTARYKRHKAGDHSFCRHDPPPSGQVPCGLGWPEDIPGEALRAWLAKIERGRQQREERERRPITGHRAGDHDLCDAESPGHGVCSECGKTVQVNRTSAPPERRRCRDCQQANPRPKGSERVGDPRVCELCEETYVPMRYGRPDQRWCSKSCAQAWRVGARPPYARVADIGDYKSRKLAQRRRRLRVHAETWDGVTDAQIFERDRWMCGICKTRIGRSFKAPHPRSKSIDHVIPLSEGGDDTAANKRAAHLGCNCGRMNRGGGEQLALIG